uniref:Uncharacterized protein n=1 Tax=viral metagenome TaxID=1070528 RepID=A0A6C0F7P4_9ZZZZ
MNRDKEPPIPITHVKPDFYRWVSQTVAYESDVYVIDILTPISHQYYKWLCKLPDYDVVLDEDSFTRDFINMLYEKYL